MPNYDNLRLEKDLSTSGFFALETDPSENYAVHLCCLTLLSDNSNVLIFVLGDTAVMLLKV